MQTFWWVATVLWFLFGLVSPAGTPQAGVAFTADLFLPGNLHPGDAIAARTEVFDIVVSYVYLYPLGEREYPITHSVAALPPGELPVELTPNRLASQDEAVTVSDQNVIEGWVILVIIGLVVIGGAGAGVSYLLSRRGPSSTRKQKKSTRLAVQTAPGQLRLKAGESRPLNVTAWWITSEGLRTPCPEAVLRFSLPEGDPGLSVLPAEGHGGVTFVVSSPEDSAGTETRLNLTASLGAETVRASVLITVRPAVQLELVSTDLTNRVSQDPDGLVVTAKLNLVSPANTLVDERAQAALAAQVGFELTGPNSELLKLAGMGVQGLSQWVRVQYQPEPGTQPGPGNPVLKAVYRDGPDEIVALLPLSLSSGELAAEHNPPQQKVIYQADQQEWALADMVVYFQDPVKPGKPVWAGFRYTFPEPAITAAPDIVEKTRLETHDGGLSWIIGLRFKPGIDLEQIYGPDLRENGGRFDVQVRAVSAEGKTYSTSLAYFIHPQLRLYAYAFDSSPSEPGGREYNGLALAEGELVANCEDQLKIAAFYCRTDQAHGLKEAYAHRLTGDFIESYSLEGTHAGAFNVERVYQDPAERAQVFNIRAARPLLYTPPNRSIQLSLELKAKEGGVEWTSRSLEVALTPQALNLRLWAFPGKRRGTSAVTGFVCLGDNPKRALAGQEIVLDCGPAAPEGPWMEVAGGQSKSATGKDGQVRFEVIYHGLKMDQLSEAVFKLRMRPGESSICTTLEINVGQNLLELLADFEQAAKALDLTNPQFTQASPWLQGLGYAWPYVLNGLYTNLSSDLLAGLANSKPVEEASERYHSRALCQRIETWMFERRFGHQGLQRANRMNGIELGHFGLGSVHEFFGFHLSGAGIMDEPLMIDPWWSQGLEDQIVVTHWQEAKNLLDAVALMAAHLTAAAASLAELEPVSVEQVMTGLQQMLGLPAEPLPVKTWAQQCIAAAGELRVKPKMQPGVHERYQEAGLCYQFPELSGGLVALALKQLGDKLPFVEGIEKW